GYNIVMDIYTDYNNDTYGVERTGYDILYPFDAAMKNLVVSIPGGGSVSVGDQFSQFTDQMNLWNELIYSSSLLDQQYELLGKGSKWPTNYDEMVIVLDKNSSMMDFYLFALGLITPNQMDDFLNGSLDTASMTFSFDELLNLRYRVMAGSDYYYQEGDRWYKKAYEDFSEDRDYIENNSIEMKVVGVVRPKSGVENGVLTGLAGYSPKLKEELIRRANSSEIVTQQKASNSNLLTGQPIGSKAKEELLISMGMADLENPSAIYLYANSFDSKDAIEAMIAKYNIENPSSPITTMDTLGMMMGFIDSLSKTVTYVLIGFSSISLIVSSIMIGIITYISVLERTKEIGILRSIGARKKDIRRVFNSESFMIGLLSGIIGVVVTCILSLPLNAIFKALLGLGGLFQLVWWQLLMLVCISVGLTLISGYIPARMAAKKDPVIALRSE
ncbi:MAG: FtsX-like permease family protein, partial [Clostridia bacterium]|nr:FtsX-like permease family protein [Clostridia bacterium]